MNTTKTIDSNDDSIDSRDVIARIEALAARDVPQYVAGCNVPGYMPDETEECENAEDAKAYLVDMVKGAEETASDDGEEEKAEALCHFAEELNLCGDVHGVFEVSGPDGYVYWVRRESETCLDADEYDELLALRALTVACEEAGVSEWDDGAQLIREDHFADYCKELCIDTDSIPHNMPEWIVIDWHATADNMKADYTEVAFSGVTYYARAC
jgi:hypothetical protein